VGGIPAAADWWRAFPGLWRAITGDVQLGFEYWYFGTRIIPSTINEFPLFSFLFADLHPHMIAIPFTMVTVALCLALADEGEGRRRYALLRWLVLTIAVGALGAINTWDLPAFWGMIGCVLLHKGYRHNGIQGLMGGIIGFLLLALGSLVLYGPFYSHYRAQSVGIDWVGVDDRSPIINWLTVWGLWLFLTTSAVAGWLVHGESWRRARRLARLGGGSTWLLRRLGAMSPVRTAGWLSSVAVLTAGIGVGVWLGFSGEWVLALTTPLLIASGVALAWSTDGGSFLRRLMLFVALGILAGVEIIYVKDFLSGGEWRRMNTLFKFYIQAWVILGLVTGAALPTLTKRLTGRVGGRLWRVALQALLAASLTYTLFAIPVRVNERFPSARPPRGTLDGTAFMRYGKYNWPTPNDTIDLRYDAEAIDWLLNHVEGTPVIAEAPIGFYREGGLRVSSYTGFPTLLGAHEREQRPWEAVGPRESDAEALYTTSSTEALFEILQRHRVHYIYVGQLEQALYAGPGLHKFGDLVVSGALTKAYSNPRVSIYQVSLDLIG